MKRDTSSRGFVVIAAVLGLGTGAVGGTLASWKRDAALPAPVEKPSPAVRNILTFVPLDSRGASRAVETVQAPDAELSSDELATNAQYDPPTSEESARGRVRDHDQRVEASRREARDSTWATATETIIREDLARCDAALRTLGRVECGSETCVAELTWDSYDVALQSYTRILQHPSRSPCGREMVLPEPARRDAPYAATVLFRCDKDGEPG